MKIINTFFLIFTISLTSCQQNTSIEKIKTEDNFFNLNDTYTKIDTIDGKSVIDNRCGVGAPNIRILKDSIYYYYPLEGSYYKINRIKKSKNVIEYNTTILPNDKNTPKSIFKIVKLENSLFKLYFEDVYKGIYINSNLIGKKIILYNGKDCDEVLTDVKIKEKENEYTVFENSTWAYDCNTSNYVTFTIDNAQFNFYDMDFGINSNLKKINENEYELRFNSPPTVPIPEDMDWENYSQNDIISKIKYINDTIEFQWFGFYNMKTRKREYTLNPFTSKMETLPIILKKCKK